MSWSLERENKLRILWAQGFSASQIAKQIGGVTRNAVIGKRIRLGLPDRASSNRSYSRKPKPPQCSPFPPKPKGPKLIAAPARAPKAPLRGPTSVRFIERRPDQCPMFCSGEEGAEGFVCGSEVEFGAIWCVACRPLIYTPLRLADAA